MNESKKKNVLVAGVTGQAGELVIEKLAASGNAVRVLVRENSVYDHLEIPGVESVFGDFIGGAISEPVIIRTKAGKKQDSGNENHRKKII